METIQNIDHTVFHWLNQGISNPFFDYFFPLIREKFIWLPLYMFLIAFFIFNFKKKGLVILLLAFTAVGIADFTSSSIIKPAVERIRPCNDIRSNPELISRVNCGAGYSFPSSHAANHFALGVFFFFVFLSISKKAAYFFPIWAALISIAQVYVGVHYPIDIFVGMILGSIIGFMEFRFYKQIEMRYFKTAAN